MRKKGMILSADCHLINSDIEGQVKPGTAVLEHTFWY